MKKLLKTLKQVVLSEEEVVAQKQPKDKPKVQESVAQKETETWVSDCAEYHQNLTQSAKPEVGPLSLHQNEDACQTDTTKCSSQRQVPFRKTGNFRDHRLFLGGLPDNLPEEEVRKAFESYGKVVDIQIPLDKETNKPKRYGFLEFESEESAKACLEDHFVTVGKRRVEIHKAWPKGAFKKDESPDKKETKEMGDFKKVPSLFGDRQSSLESLSCSGSESNAENSQLMYQKLFENYFKAKFLLENVLGRESFPLSEENKKREEEEMELEKILRGLHVTIKDSSEDEEADEDDDDDNDDSFGDTEETPSTVDEFESCFQDSVISSDETAPMRNDKNICYPCNWAPSDNSVEEFLAHCKTPAHRQKLKERFKKHAVRDNSQTRADTKNYNQNYWQNTKTKHAYRRKLPSKNDNQSNNKNEMKSVLEEIMTSVQAKTEKCIKCKMCNKTIPPAADTRVLMTNLSHHLQSKGHLARIHELQKSRKENPAENSAEKKTTHAGKKYSKNGPNNKDFRETTKQPKKESSDKTKKGPPPPHFKSESLPQANASASASKPKFRCLVCNYFCSMINTFANHLTSESHLAKDQRNSSKPFKTASSESLRSNLKNCLNCDAYLYGCPDSIKNHYAKCKKPE